MLYSHGTVQRMPAEPKRRSAVAIAEDASPAGKTADDRRVGSDV